MKLPNVEIDINEEGGLKPWLTPFVDPTHGESIVAPLVCTEELPPPIEQEAAAHGSGATPIVPIVSPIESSSSSCTDVPPAQSFPQLMQPVVKSFMSYPEYTSLPSDSIVLGPDVPWSSIAVSRHDCLYASFPVCLSPVVI